MRVAASAAAAAGLVAMGARSCDGLAVGTDHACVLLDDASVKVRERDDLRCCVAPNCLSLGHENGFQPGIRFQMYIR